MTKRHVIVVNSSLLTLVLLILIAIGGFMWLLWNDPPPQFFPLNNSQGKYLVTKKCPPQGNHDNPKPEKPGNTYCVIYNGSNVFMDEESGNTNAFTVTIGKSAIDLAPFENAYVTNINGAFAAVDKQCIQDRCVSLGGSWVALNIDSLEFAKR